MASVAQAILTIEKQMERDFNGGKIDAVMAHFDAKVVGFSSTQHKRVVGRRAMQKTFQYYLDATSRVRYTIEQPEVHVFGDTAVATFYWTVELGTGRPRHAIKGRGSHIFVQKDGKWVIAHEHFIEHWGGPSIEVRETILFLRVVPVDTPAARCYVVS